MAPDANDNVAEENFNIFRESMYQYLNESIKDFTAIKPQLLDIFKTHRPIRNVDYQYGLSKSVKGKSQLIIHEFSKNRSAVREYFKAGNQVWHCCECTRIGASKNDDGIADLIVVHGVVFVKLEHDCKPRDLSFVQKVQKLYKEKKVEEADVLQKEVLGSEDLNVPVKQKSGAAKRETKADSSKLKEEILAEVRLRYAQLQVKETEEKHPSTMDERIDESIEELSPAEAFEKFIENLGEYTDENKEVVMANKSKICSLLKTRYPLKIVDYHYGMMLNLRNNRRLIVFEWNDKTRVRVYSKRNGHNELWVCLECYRLNGHKGKNSFTCSLMMVNGVVFVLRNHDCKCLPRDYRLVTIYQKYLEDGDAVKARAVARAIDFTFGQSFAPSTFNTLDLPSTSSLPEKTTLKRKMASDDKSDHVALDERSPVQKKSKLNESKLVDNVTDENDPDLFDEKIPVRNKSKQNKIHKNVNEKVDSSIRSEPTTSDASNSIYYFEKPSTSKLQEICEILNIQYRNKAAKLWDIIMFNQIDTVSSKPAETHYFETENFYQILSIFFTGKSKQHEQIKATIIDAFREQMVSSVEITTMKFNKQYLDTVTDEHFVFIAKYLSCRILIFDGENGIKKYGKWKSSSSIRLTLVVALRNGYYSIVLKL